MTSLAKEVQDRLNVIDSTLETQSQGCAYLPIRYLEQFRETFQRVLDEEDVPTLTEYINTGHGGRI